MSFRQKIRERRQKGELDEAVYEAFGKKRQDFKEGKQVVYFTATCESHVRQLQAACDPAPLEPCPIVFPSEADLTPEQQANAFKAPPSPSAPPLIATRFNQNMGPIKFRNNRKSPKVMEKTKQLMMELHVNKQVALRLALLHEYDDLEDGKRILQLYLGAMERMKQGIHCLKLNQKSLKVSKKILFLNESKEYLRLKSDGKVFSLGAVTLNLRIIEDVFPGTRESSEFNTLNKRLKAVGQRLQEDRCCVLKTVFRTYSLIFARITDMHDLCAIVDLFKGKHGPAAWQSDIVNADAVFRLEDNLKPTYDLREALQ